MILGQISALHIHEYMYVIALSRSKVVSRARVVDRLCGSFAAGGKN